MVVPVDLAPRDSAGSVVSVLHPLGRALGDGALEPLPRALPERIGADSGFDGVWVTRRGSQVLILNKSDVAVSRRVTIGGKPTDVTIPPWTISEVK